jgi:predicted nucleic acid-binding protein
MAVDLHHPVYDCLYLSLAVLRRARMVTADERFAKKVQSRPTYVRHIVLLKDMAH